MDSVARPDLNAIKARLGTLAPGKLARIAADAPDVATLIVDVKHLVAYVEQDEKTRRAKQEFSEMMDGKQ